MDNPPFLIPSVILIIIAIPLIIGWIPRNRFYGVRTCKTLSDDRIWYAANRFGGWLFVASSLIYLAIAFSVPWWAHITGLFFPLAISIFVIYLYTKKL
ncbi:MAG: SdpI family protein [Nitrospirota bacterium]